MDSKEIKSKLKAAREALKNKDHKEALKHCKAVLSFDKNNYNALVFAAVAAAEMDQPEQAIKAYQRAIETNPNQILAWQGLCSFYEKKPTEDSQTELVSVYNKLQELYENDQEKRSETLQKLAALSSEMGFIEQAVSAYQKLMSVTGETSHRGITALKELSQLLEKDKDQSEMHGNVLASCYKKCLESQNVPSEEKQWLTEGYISSLVKNNDQEFLKLEINRLLAVDPENQNLIDYALLLELDANIGKLMPLFSKFFTDCVNKAATSVEETSAIMKICIGACAIISKDYNTATELLKKGLQQNSLIYCGHYYLMLTLYHLHETTVIEKAYNMALKAIPKKVGCLTISPSSLIASLHMLQAKICLQQTSLGMVNNMVKILQETTVEDREIVLTIAYLYIKLEKYEQAAEYAEKLSEAVEDAEVIALRGWIHFHEGDFTKALEKLSTAVSLEPNNSKFQLMLGRTYWQLKDISSDLSTEECSQKCFASLLQAARFDPYNGEIFLYLGHFYLYGQQNKEKAKKCYQKAFDLDSENAEVGAAFCDIMMDSRDDKVLEYLKSVTAKAGPGSAKWAWLRLGLHQLKNENPNAAVTALQAALRPDPLDHHVWECLGEAYVNRGSYTAALKAFTKASELDPQSIYSQYMIASIKQTLGLFSESVPEYKLILEKEPYYVPALKGIGETLLLQAKSFLSRFLDCRVLDACEEAIFYLTRAAGQRPDLSCLWKLLGDACTLPYIVDRKNFRDIMIPCKLLQANNKDPEKKTGVTKSVLLELGSRCYGRALKIYPECASLWHDLGINFLYQSRELHDRCKDENQSDDSEVKVRIQKALDILKQAITLDPQNCKHWDALGIALCSKDCFNPKLAQHCFIKSIQVENNNAVAWTNLGALYLKSSNLQLAHEAFKVAQSLDPSYVGCWIGQAIIAESVGHEDAMDLFRHTTELSNHTEACIGYGHWVCSTLLDTNKVNTELYQYSIEQLAAVPAASDALAKYTERIHNDSLAFNMYGILLERQGLLSLANRAFEKAVDILEMEEPDSENLQKARSNLARVKGSMGYFKGALKQYKLMKPLDNLEDLCGLALTLFKNEQFKECYQAYSKVLQITEEYRSHVMTAQAFALLNSGNVSAAVELLMTASQLTPPSVEGLKALCAIGLLRSDQALTSAVVQELLKMEDPEQEHLVDITWLTAAEMINKGNLQEGRCYIQKLVHKYPWRAPLWILMAKVIMWFAPEDAQMASSCILYAQQIDCSLNKNVAPLLVQSLLAAGLHCSWNTNQNGFSVAQKAYHVHPDDPHSMINLVSGIHAGAVIKQCVKQKVPDSLYFTEMMFIDHILLEMAEEIASSVSQWMWKLKSWTAMYIFPSIEDLKFVWKQMLESSAFRGDKSFNVLAYIRTLEGVKVHDLDIVKEGVVQAGGLLKFWQILEEVSIHQGMVEDAEFIAGQCVNLAQADSARQGRLLPMIRIALYSFKRLMKEKSCRYSLSMFEEAVKEVLELDPLCTMANLMCGVVGHHTGSKKRNVCDDLEQVVNDDKVTGGLGFAASIARQHLLCEIMKNKGSDPFKLKSLLKDAQHYRDLDTINLYKALECE